MSFSTGRPAALEEPADGPRLAQTIAELQGCQAAALGASTLHLFWDYFGTLDPYRDAIFLDAGAYPIARWGVERGAGRGMPVHSFAHFDSEDLARQIRRFFSENRRRPVLVVTDGFCPGCGRPAPIAEYLAIARHFRGRVLIDDSQALGILGRNPTPNSPYGEGGGGSLRWQAVSGDDTLCISSLAKGFGVPIAVMAGSEAAVNEFVERSDTRVHCSPPSNATIRAAAHAMSLNRHVGDSLRQRLWELVKYFRHRLRENGVAVTGGIFPVQTFRPTPDLAPRRLYRHLLRVGIRTFLRRDHGGHGPLVSLVITTRHSLADLERLVWAVSTVSTPQLASL